MAKYSTNKIDNKNIDWSRDPENGLPYSGEAVQEWIKEQLDSRAGCFYYDATNNRFLVFADEDNRDKYLDNPIDNASLLIGTFDAPFNYTASIELVDTESVNYIQSGSTGNYIKAQFDVVNKSGASVGENMNVTITFRNGSAVSRAVRSVTYGSTLVLNIDDYLSTGTNIITLAAVGQNTLAATSIGLTYYAIKLELSDTFDISSHVSPIGNLDIAFNIVGGGVKRMEWFIDGVQVPYDSQNDDVTASEASRTKSIYLPSYNLANGRHNLQYRAYVETADGSLFYSDIMYRDFIVDSGTFQDYVVVASFDYPYNASYGTNGIVDPTSEPIPIYGAVQYMAKDIKYAVHCYEGEHPMQISFGGNITNSVAANQHVYTYTMQSFNSGTSYLAFSFGTDILEFNVSIAGTQYADLEEVTNGLVFALDKSDRTNASENRDSWSYGPYSAVMTGFSYTDRSGWTKDGLLIPDGASFVTNYTPLSGDIVTNGFTFEMEFETQRVLDDDEVICDLRTSGTGILITASEASITSRGNISVSTKYKSGVPLRVSFVVNSPTAARNKNLLFIYIDGILAGAVTYASTDSFTSGEYLQFAGSSDASILVKQVRCYNRALSASEIINNYTLYRPTAQELVNVYDRNDILDESSQPSYEKLAAYTPVIIITGDVEKLMNFDRSNKGTYVKMDKIEIINNFDTTKNLTLYDASMRCQGTSSMDYPRKNFRFYLAKDSADTTVNSYVTRVFDYQGHELEGGDRKYAFKDGAQPVNCWCLKADYAESSSTHNTGVARLWNTVMKNAVVNNVDSRHYVLDYYEDSKNPCRTLAQHAADANGFNKDVRTTVDGFPIVLFYHRYESDALICLGKYNWNNDKSTESVYGFCDIPGFDDSNVECWEVVNGDYPANTFDDVSDWDTTSSSTLGWRNAFEARYPDDSGKASEATRANGALKDVADWIYSTKGASKVYNDAVVVDSSSLMTKFSTEKWQHLDVYKMAAYYVYLMRFGGVDQTVKNAMFTTEDGIHWFYINYDNDTILGVRNDGLLRFGYDIDRQSKDPDNQNAYCYAGHSSVLWNNLEADEEFMDIVKVVDQALFKAGLTYPNVIKMFNEEQSGAWGERLHNYDYTYKYLDVWLDSQNNQLEKLQGPRRTHREWWLANRFAIYDAKNMTGQYLESSINIKPITSDTPAVEGDSVFVTPKVDGQVFGWRLGTDGTLTSTTGSSGVPIEFDLAGNSYYIGGSFFFFNAVYMEKIDFSAISQHIAELHVESANSDVFDSYLEELIVSNTESETNTTLSGINGIGYAKYLNKLQMCNCTAVTTLDLSQNIYLEDIDLRGCTGLTSVTTPVAAPITSIQLPANLQALHMQDLVDLTTLTIEGNGTSLVTINVSNCKPFSDSLTWLKTWITGKSDAFLATCTVVVEGIDWTDVDVDDLLLFGKIGNLSLRGKVQANIDEPATQIPALQAIYGEHCFDSTNELWIIGESVYRTFLVPESIVEGETAQCTFVVVGVSGIVTYDITNNSNSRAGVSIGSATGQLSTTINNTADTTLTIRATFIPSDPSSQYYFVETKNIMVLKETYPSASDITISGPTELYDSQDKTYSAVVANSSSYTGMAHLSHTWSVTGDLASYYTIASQPASSLECTMACTDNTYIVVEGKVRLDFTNTLGTIVAYKEYDVFAQSGNVAVSRSKNPELMTAFWNAFGTNGTKEANKLSNANYITKVEASTFVASDLGDGTQAGSIFYNSGLKNFEEIQWFNSLDSIPANLFKAMSTLTGNLPLPDSVTSFPLSAIQCNKGSATGPSLNVTGSGVLTVGSGSSFTINSNLSFPNCTTWNSDNADFRGNNIYIPKCTSFAGSLYNQSTSNKVTITVGSLNFSYSAAITANIVNLIVSKYCEYPTSGGLWVANTNAYSPRNILASISVEEGVTLFDIRDGCLFYTSTNELLKAPYGYSSSTLPSGTAAIHEWAFSGCTSLQSITTPSTCVSVGNSAFKGAGLVSFASTDGLQTIGEYAFVGITTLTSATIAPSVTSLGNSCFRDCTALATVTYATPTSLTTIGNDCFYGCTSLSEIFIPDSVTSLGGTCAQGCSSLEEFVYGSGLTAIPVITGRNNPLNSLQHMVIKSKGTVSDYVGNSAGLTTAGPIGGSFSLEYSWDTTLPQYTMSGSVLIEGTIPSTVTQLSAYSINCANMTKIYCYATVAPDAARAAFGCYYENNPTGGTGYNTRTDGVNELHVPIGATGYDSGRWSSELVGALGFTVIYDL